ncbi:serine/threonine protein kinase [Thalassoglobus polymorphus]|uniref:non-specific serine/threonine protein kinase n=1 Tax=Thalassoglobus polymorphus TaxID=2527994 RepID=A0A517QV66_9PLAN|nr:serine/threonine-protein kinase [Thalassoglobus polymorphus]QDT35513.1 Serine/threonine-protein kinase PrkC [Thalassoglobus polymorphus]
MSTSESDFHPETEADRELPATIGPYFIERKLGSGGMGTVYLGRHQETDEFAAVKLLPASMAREAGFVARFDREIAAMKQLTNPHIVELYENGEDLGSYFYTMEFVDGETLADRLEREGRIPWREVIDYSVQVCSALKAAHNAGIIHRDLKPSNLLIGKDGTIKLTDFGVAQVFASGKLTVTGGILGTAEYMSPEQAQGKRATKQSDLYSLGAVMYVMLTGRPPFTGKTALDIIQKHRFSQFDSVKRLVPEVPFWLDEVVCQCLSKKQEDRYPDAYVLSLRLKEIPKKVDLKEQQESEYSELVGTAETMADVAPGASLGDEVGGTLVRDLFRAQMDAEKPDSKLHRLLDNTWVLVGVLLLTCGLVYVLFRINTPSQEQLFQRGEDLMDRPAGLAWEAAKKDYFLPLIEADRERWEPEVTPYLDQIEIYELRKTLFGKATKQQPAPKSEAEAIILQAMELRRQGRLAEARSKLMAFYELLGSSEEDQNLSALLIQMISEITNEMPPDRLDYVRAALERADTFLQEGQVERAIAIWFSIKKLYDSDPDAVELVDQAELKYFKATGVQLLGKEDLPISDAK